MAETRCRRQPALIFRFWPLYVLLVFISAWAISANFPPLRNLWAFPCTSGYRLETYWLHNFMRLPHIIVLNTVIMFSCLLISEVLHSVHVNSSCSSLSQCDGFHVPQETIKWWWPQLNQPRQDMKPLVLTSGGTRKRPWSVLETTTSAEQRNNNINSRLNMNYSLTHTTYLLLRPAVI